jgi:glycerate 2-kinase
MPSAEEHRTRLLEVYAAALQSVNGRERVRAYLAQHPLAGDVHVIALGKAATAMMHGALDALGGRIQDAFIVTKHGHGKALPWPCIEAGHPLPDEHSLAAGAALVEYARQLPLAAQVLVLLSGGASSLVELPRPGITLDDLRAFNQWLLASGLNIVQCNVLRKRLSQIKGGQLARWLAPRPVLSLSLSDVPGDDPSVIASGPLVADTSVLDRNEFPSMPAQLRALLPKEALPMEPEWFRHVRTEVIATLPQAKAAAAQAAQRLGYRAQVHGEFIAGDAQTAAMALVHALRTGEAGVVQVWGGETTVQLPAHPGRGGRSQSLALAAALALVGEDKVFFLAAGTDGSDGSGTDAGALVDGASVARGREQGLDARAALAAADAGTFLEASGDLIETGPTGTNVMDIMLGLKYA